MNHLSELQLT